MVLDHLPSQKPQSSQDGSVIRIALGHIPMSSCQVTSHEADRRVVDVQSDPDPAFVTAQPLQSRPFSLLS